MSKTTLILILAGLIIAIPFARWEMQIFLVVLIYLDLIIMKWSQDQTTTN